MGDVLIFTIWLGILFVQCTLRSTGKIQKFKKVASC